MSKPSETKQKTNGQNETMKANCAIKTNQTIQNYHNYDIITRCQQYIYLKAR